MSPNLQSMMKALYSEFSCGNYSFYLQLFLLRLPLHSLLCYAIPNCS